MQLQDRVVVVTGANGFVGARTCAVLLAEGAQVRALVRREGTAPDGTTEVVGDVGDAADCARAVDGATDVVHTVATADQDLDVARAVNVDATRTVADAALAAGVRRFVHVSTTSVYAADPGPVVDEDAPLAADDDHPYSVTKRDAEAVVLGLVEDGLPGVVLRPPTVHGWGPSSNWGWRVPSAILAGEWHHPGAPDSGMAWVHVDDLAGACRDALLADDGAVGAVCNVIAGTRPWGDYVDAVRALGEDVPSPFAQDGVAVQREWPAERAATLLGWSPQHTLEEAWAEVAANLG